MTSTAALTVMRRHFHRGNVFQTTITMRYYLRPRGEGDKRREKKRKETPIQLQVTNSTPGERSTSPLPAPTSMI